MRCRVTRPEPDKDFPWDPARLRGVLELAAKKAEWGKALPPGHGVGIACAIDHLSYGADRHRGRGGRRQAAHPRVVIAADCGPVMNPSGARAQMEGGVTQALSAALREKITVAGGRVEQGNFDKYPILRMHEAPAVIEPLRGHGRASHGAGRAVGAAGGAGAGQRDPARATGKRLRSLPLQL